MNASRTASAAKLVVVIDDDPLVREATGMLLRSWGCRVVAAESYDDAVTRLAASEAGRRPAATDQLADVAGAGDPEAGVLELAVHPARPDREDVPDGRLVVAHVLVQMGEAKGEI